MSPAFCAKTALIILIAHRPQRPRAFPCDAAAALGAGGAGGAAARGGPNLSSVLARCLPKRCGRNAKDRGQPLKTGRAAGDVPPGMDGTPRPLRRRDGQTHRLPQRPRASRPAALCAGAMTQLFQDHYTTDLSVRGSKKAFLFGSFPSRPPPCPPSQVLGKKRRPGTQARILRRRPLCGLSPRITPVPLCIRWDNGRSLARLRPILIW